MNVMPATARIIARDPFFSLPGFIVILPSALMGGIIHSDVAGECTRRYPNRVAVRALGSLPKIRRSRWSAVIMSGETEADVRFLGILLLTAPLLAQAPTPAPPSQAPPAPGNASAAMVRVGSMSE